MDGVTHPYSSHPFSCALDGTIQNQIFKECFFAGFLKLPLEFPRLLTKIFLDLSQHDIYCKNFKK